MLKIALIVPRGSKYGKNIYLKSFLERNDVVSNFYGAWETPNLGLLTIAGLTPKSYDVSFIDEDHGQTVKYDQGYDLVAITAMTQQINRAYEISAEFRKIGTYVAIGGIHATIMPDEVEKHADTVMIGEGESIWPQFLMDVVNGSPRKRYGSKEYADLSKSPIPRYDLLDKTLYKSYSIQTTRGCPRSCNYCTLPIIYGRTYRHKSVEQVINEVKAIKSIDSNPFIFFADDNMFIMREYSKALLKELSKLNITWGTQTDISVAEDDELLKLLYASGCHWLFIGFENVSESGLNFLDDQRWKACQLRNYETSIEKIHKNGINIWGSFMFGGDNDDETVFQETLNFTLKNGLYSGSFTILTPLPGTQLYNQMKSNGRIIDNDWSRYTFWDVVYKPTNMSPDNLAQGVAWVYDSFYSKENVRARTKRLKERLRSIRTV
ncbi:B12-binding domain-containing radical SAM protein [Lutispora saccharofermentans]|uniref:B12-binding domain-containing radical SAM protein n=1 Tax=Lutispora saccharofermentans TaxID=3024236 RepID=A0ABT1NLV6_9FIRM|nr:B12-binding domain-containing radical SAM protein [Lutispora saccharofermentans]